ncbi:MAG: hypothetical protein KGQ59_11325 [Bdellovibrionales bacterium]|nr:hypothetical protein [Bdellovibrionales bacterium]
MRPRYLASKVCGLLFALPWLLSLEAVAQEYPDTSVSSTKSIELRAMSPEGFKFNNGAPHRLELRDFSSSQILRSWKGDAARASRVELGKLPVLSAGYLIDARYFVCDKVDNRICVTVKVKQRVQSSPAHDLSVILLKLSLPSGVQRALKNQGG